MPWPARSRPLGVPWRCVPTATASAPGGLAGGASGAPSSNLLIRGDDQARPLASKASLVLRAGDLLRHTLAGAGGHGDPFERDPELVAADVADGKISPTVARAEYGVVLDTATGVLDAAATEALRASHRRA